MNAAQFLDLILPEWRATSGPEVGFDYFDDFIRRRRDDVELRLEPLVRLINERARQRDGEEAPPDEWTPARRTKANLAAMRLLASGKQPAELTPAERTVLRRYSGWGGLSIDNNRDNFPKGWDPETFGLIHEYYTPSKVAQAIGEMVCPLLDKLKGANGRVLALEPSAGIGRLIHGVEQAKCEGKPPIDWITIEYSRVSSAILPRLWPDHEHHHGSFESWIDKNSTEHEGRWKPDFYHRVQLVISNPPYGERGLTRRDDPVREYREERMAYAYFMRRALDLLVPRGVGVFLVPAGFMTGQTPKQRELRERILRRHHLAAAYRLPSNLFPGAQLVTDLLVWRARGGALADIDPDDEFIARGEYFEEHPTHILGKEQGRDAGRDDQLTTRRGRRWYKVVGTFEELPPFWERGICEACQIRPWEFPSAASRAPTSSVRKLEVSADGYTPAVEAALYLGVRISGFLSALGADDPTAPQLWKDLHATLMEFWDSKLRKDEAPDNPHDWDELKRVAAAGSDPAQVFLNAWTPTGDLVAALREEPIVRPRWSGAPEDVVGQAKHVYLGQRHLTLEEFEDFHRAVGGPYPKSELLSILLEADWNLDPTIAPESSTDTYLSPLADYITGVLWPRYDYALEQPGEQWAKQAERLRKAIKLVEIEDIEGYSPQDGWVPVSLVSEWAQQVISAGTKIDRAGGIYTIQGLDYTKIETYASLVPESLWLLGWLNHEASLFNPRPPDSERPKGPDGKKKPLEPKPVRRKKKIEEWERSFRAWIDEDDERRNRLTDAYNRAFRGYTIPQYSDAPLPIARWADKIQLYPHQVAGARRVLANRGGLVAFDTGVGKTYTLLAILARAREEGWARRPVLITPVSLLWKWRNDFEKALPDFRVAVIGSELFQRQRGKVVDEAKALLEAGSITEEQYKYRVTASRPDSKANQARKWMAFIAGAYDAVILSVEAMGAIKVEQESVVSYAENLAAVQRSIAITTRNARKLEAANEERRANDKQVKKDLSERQKAIMEHKTAGWVADKLEGQKKEKDFVPGVTWGDLNVDLLLVDEAAMFKNLWGVVKSWGDIPKWIGNSQPSARAWQFDFRAAAVRRRNGGTGIVLATATPWKNGPGEAYSMINYIDDQAWTRLGIDDPYQFVDQFVRIEQREYIDQSSFNPTEGPAVVGFQNLDILRTVVLRYGEFRTAEEVGLALPEPKIQQVYVDLDDRQEEKYAYEVARLEKLLKLPMSSEEEEEQAEIRADILGIQARLTLVALHAQADEGYSWKTAKAGGVETKKIQRRNIERFLEQGWELARALTDKDKTASVRKDLPRPDPRSPKGLKCAELILAQPGCGHIVFCQNLAPQVWLLEVLVEAGIDRKRIGVLNAQTDAADRPKIAKFFTGDPDAGEVPTLDVVIANSVAYEGLDLQTRTCAIHHLDLPWTPGDLEQRNGRAYRQKNSCPILNIYYYIARGSTDGVRLNNVQGKSTWMADLLDLEKTKVNNPAADSDLSAEDMLIELSRDKEAVKRLIAEKKGRAREEAYAKVRQLALKVMATADIRYRKLRAALDPERADELRSEAEGALKQVLLTDRKAWPWVEWAATVRDVRWLLPLKDSGTPVFENLRIVRRNKVDTQQIEAFEFGIVYGLEIAMRVAGGGSWRIIDTAGVQGLGIIPEDMPGKSPHEWPADDDARTRDAIERNIGLKLRTDGTWAGMGWRGASDAWVARWWPVFEDRIIDGLSKSVRGERLPVVRDGNLEFRTGPTLREVEVLPPTLAGWRRFLALAPASGESYRTLQTAGELWWWRDVPHGLLSKQAARAATVYTPGTRISWRGVGDWIQGLKTIQARDDKKRRAAAMKSHLDALAQRPAVLVAADDLDALEAVVRGLGTDAELKEAAASLLRAIADSRAAQASDANGPTNQPSSRSVREPRTRHKDASGLRNEALIGRELAFAHGLGRCPPEDDTSEQCYVVHDKPHADSDVVGRVREAVLSDARFWIDHESLERVAAKEEREACCFIVGSVEPRAAAMSIEKQAWRRIRFNPLETPCFFEESTGKCVRGAAWVRLRADRGIEASSLEYGSPHGPKGQVSPDWMWSGGEGMLDAAGMRWIVASAKGPLQGAPYAAEGIGADGEVAVTLGRDFASAALAVRAVEDEVRRRLEGSDRPASPPAMTADVDDAFATKGVRARWRDLGEWLDLMIEIEGRRSSAGKDAKIRAHVHALADNLDAVLAVSSDEQVVRLWRAWGGGKHHGKDRWTGRGEVRARILDGLDRRCAKRNKSQRAAEREEAPRVREVLDNAALIESYRVWFEENDFTFTGGQLRVMAETSATTREKLVRTLLDRLHKTFAWMLLTWAWVTDERKTRGYLKHDPAFIEVPDEAVLWRDTVPYLLVTSQGAEFPLPAVWVELEHLEGEPRTEEIKFHGGSADVLSISAPIYKYAIRDPARAKELFHRTPHIALFTPFDGLEDTFGGRAREIRRSFREPEVIERSLAIVAELDALMTSTKPIASEVVRVAPAPRQDATVERAIELLKHDAHKVERLYGSYGSGWRVRIWVDRTNYADVTLYPSRLAAAWDWSGLDRGGRSRRAWVKTYVDAALHGRRSEIGDLAGTSLDGDIEFRQPRVLEEMQDDPELTQLASILAERVREQALMSPHDALEILKRLDFEDAATQLSMYVRDSSEGEDEREAREEYWSNEGRIIVELREKLLEVADARTLDIEKVPGRAIFGSKLDRYILKTGPEGQDLTRVPVVVKNGGDELDRDAAHAVIVRSAHSIGTGDKVLVAFEETETDEDIDESASEFREAFETVDALWRWIKVQPDSLQEYRDILDQATALVLEDKCQDDRAKAITAIEQAEKLWREAVEDVHEPFKQKEVEKIRSTMKAIAEATLEVASSCASGVRALFATTLPSSMTEARARFGEKLAGERSVGIARAVRDSLSPDLRKASSRADEDRECKGYSYTASEAIWHLLGGASSGYQPHRIVHEGRPHWYLMSDGDVIDVTACQFRSRVPYREGQRRAFITARPSRRARLLMTRTRARMRSRRAA